MATPSPTGSAAWWVRNIWDLAIDDASVLHTTFSNVTDVRQDQAFPDNYPGGDHPAKTGAAEVNTLGYTAQNRAWGDTVYHLTYTVAHSEASASVRFTGEFRDVYAVPEGWGIDNVVVSVAPRPRSPM